VVGFIVFARGQRGAAEPARAVLERRQNWRMPALALLERPEWSLGRRAAMYALRGYLVVAAVLLLVKTVQLGTGGH
jgi:hypothetical protein